MMRHIKMILSGITAGLLLALVAVVPVGVLAVTNQSIAVPLFAKPGTNAFWDNTRSAGSSSVPFVVASPSNGPGAAADPAYTAAIAENTKVGQRTLGYIQTNYQMRSFREAYRDIDMWHTLYPQTSGIYIDLLKEGGQDEVCYAAALYGHVKNRRPNDLVVLGPGTHLSAAYEPYGDIFVNANMDYATYKSWRIQHKGFEDRSQYQNRFWHIIHGVSQSQYSDAFTDIRDNNAGWVFMTDKTAPSPFSETPVYWQNEASDVGVLPESAVPNRGKTTLPRGCISLSSSADNTVDTRTATQSTTTSSITVNNTDNSYDSEPLTAIRFMSMPKGMTVDAMAATGWTCSAADRVCSYGAVIPPSSSLPAISTQLTATCDYAGGDALLRLTNYAGNQWDLKIPVRPPFGCAPATPAGKLNRETSGITTSLTTQSIETTPEIKPLGGESTPVPSEEAPKDTSRSPIVKLLAITVIVICMIGLAVWAVIIRRRRNRYKVDI